MLYNPVLLTSNLVNLGSSFLNVTASVGVQTLVAPAANTNGLILRTYSWQVVPGYTQAGFYADTSAPSGYNDLSKRAIFMTVQAATSPGGVFAAAPNLVISPGWGLYFAATATQGTFSLTWDPL